MFPLHLWVPAGQLVHMLLDAVLCVPGGHGVQDPDFVELCVLTGQGEHGLLPPDEYSLAAHSMHAVCSVSFVKDPGGHTTHASAATLI